jgi:hypothetical protein
MYTPKNIKKFKGQMICIRYNTHKTFHELTGVITATTKKHVLFLVNNEKNGDEITLHYEDISEIKKPEKPSRLNFDGTI